MILQAREPSGTPTVVKSTWIHRIKTHEDKVSIFGHLRLPAIHHHFINTHLKVILHGMAKKADLVPSCDVVKPSIYEHSCSAFCPW